MDTGLLHHEIIESFIERGFPPTPMELEERLDTSTEEVLRGLELLAGQHGVVLHPSRNAVWIAHPFSASPTSFTVRSASREWWAPCSWCALGIAALVPDEVEIATSLGSDSSPVRLRVGDASMVETDLVVHFAVPMAEVWRNVVHACSTMIIFRNEAEVDAWSEAHRIPKGDVQPVSKVWQLAREWYSGHRARDWTKRSASEAQALFARLGLTGPVWELPDGGGRF